MKSLFGRDSPEDWLPRLRALADSFRTNQTDVDTAVEFALSAWSMVDLVVEHGGLQKNIFIQNLERECPALFYMQDVANKRKHGSITRYTPILRESREHKGAFSSDFSRDFDISRLELVTADGNVVWFEDAVAEVIAYWERHFASQ